MPAGTFRVHAAFGDCGMTVTRPEQYVQCQIGVRRWERAGERDVDVD